MVSVVFISLSSTAYRLKLLVRIQQEAVNPLSQIRLISLSQFNQLRKRCLFQSKGLSPLDLLKRFFKVISKLIHFKEMNGSIMKMLTLFTPDQYLTEVVYRSMTFIMLFCHFIFMETESFGYYRRNKVWRTWKWVHGCFYSRGFLYIRFVGDGRGIAVSLLYAAALEHLFFSADLESVFSFSVRNWLLQQSCFCLLKSLKWCLCVSRRSRPARGRCQSDVVEWNCGTIIQDAAWDV